MKFGGVVLCGGKSARMGRAKATLPFGPELLLQRVVRAVREAADAVVVVAAPGQNVPALPAGVRLVRDEVEDRGPLGGLAAGLAALEGECEAAFLSACDAPFLTAAFVRRVACALEAPTPTGPPSLKGRGESEPWRVETVLGAPTATGSDSPLPFREGGPGGVGAAVPVTDRPHPLAAAYRVEVLPVVRAMLAANELRMTDLLARVPARLMGPAEFIDIDPELKSLRNLNAPEEYAAALRELGAS